MTDTPISEPVEYARRGSVIYPVTATELMLLTTSSYWTRRKIVKRILKECGHD